LKRFEEEGFEGLKDRSSAPHNSPTATSADVVVRGLDLGIDLIRQGASPPDSERCGMIWGASG
jgi:hypothetical protein